MRLNFRQFLGVGLALSVAALAACESRDSVEYRYVPPEVQARGPNAPFPVPEPMDKPEAAYPIDAPAPDRKEVGMTALEDVPGGGTIAPPPKRPSYGGTSVSPPKPAAPGQAKPSAPGGVIVGKSHTVVQGDTVYAIARKYGVNAREIIALNGLEPPYALKVGQKLKIPGGDHHSVVPGDTLYSISRRYSVDINRLQAANGIDDSHGIVIGQILVIPAASGGALAPATSVADVVPADTAPANARPAKPLAGGFLWPAKGRVISPFGDKHGGARNDGINIRVPRGTPVVAAAAGTVAYAGNELKGFGNLILLRHDQGWVSAYAHNDDILVSQGQAVNRGAVIARAGASGQVGEPQLHFELRQGAKAVDPTLYLPPA